jgi:hypothetical protein
MKLRLWEIHAASRPTGEIPGPPDGDPTDGDPTDGPPDDHADRDHARVPDEDECCALLRPDPPRHVSARRRVRRGARER